ncbi:MAG: DUF2207 domain-containing protein [Eubacterium sp.]|nr:DUF2207 domain-containing protein [Eubacterium sp.]
MKIIKKSFLFLMVLVLLSASAVTAFAVDIPYYGNNVRHPYSDYYIESYDIKMNVLENNTLEITENISAYFNQQKHGLFRKIPLLNYVERADGSIGATHAKVKNLSVSDTHDAYTDGNYYVIQIGDEEKTVLGKHNYTISYSYVMGKDIGEGYDELYFNLIGTDWDTYIDGVTFSITMPKEFDSSKLGFSTGAYGAVGTENVEYTVTGNEISGRVTEELSMHEALTVRLELPEDYFYFNLAAYYARLAAMVAVPVLAFLIVLVLWIKFGRDKKVVEIVEFYPPDNMSSLDVAFWKSGMVASKDTIPLMIELANEGYIKINQVEKKKFIGSKTDFVIEKVLPVYNGHDKCKHIFFNGLFKNNKTSVTSKDLQNKFYKTIEKITNMVNTSENRKLVFDSKSQKLVMLGILLSVAGGIAACFIHSGTIGGSEKTIALAAGIALAIFSLVFSFFIRRRTDKGHEYLQRIMGFKKFLETAEKEKLEMLVEENPEYYYDILPYAYVLGVSDKWTKNFESIALEPPQWYGGTVFDRMIFWHFMNSTYNSAAASMTSAPQSSSGGSFSGGGGGFSGGGSGGGGGGSW